LISADRNVAQLQEKEKKKEERKKKKEAAVLATRGRRGKYESRREN
jgi:hypothetical protein